MNDILTKAMKNEPERGDDRTRLLEAARDVIRQKGFAVATVDDLCKAAGVTKGAYFHHFRSKVEVGVAPTEFWAQTTSVLFANAPYHEPEDPLGRILAYLDFRKAIVRGDPSDFTYLVGTMTQEVYDAHPAIRDACTDSIFGHAATLEPDFEAAMVLHGFHDEGLTAKSIARHTQAVLQGAFVLAKATGDAELARESVEHLKRYIELIFASSNSEEINND